MNKNNVVILLGSLFFVLTSSALERKGADSIQAILFYKTNQGFEETMSFSMNDREIQLPNRKIPIMDAVGYLKTVRKALKMSSHIERSPCSAGEYFHGITIQGKKKIEVGCLDDAHFSRLSAAFTALESL